LAAQLDASHERTHAHVHALGRVAQIADEPRDKPRPVLTLEGDLLVMDDD
jgi:hypothetical protein